jgi:hypothetical protein
VGVLIELVVFLFLVALPVALNLREVPERVRDLRRGIRGLAYVPVTVVVLFVAATGAWLLAQQVPILQWGWLGENIIAAPLADLLPEGAQGAGGPGGGGGTAGGGGTGGGGTGSGTTGRTGGGSGGDGGFFGLFSGPSLGELLGPGLTLAIFVPIILLALLIFNFYEEAFYRDSLQDVVVWAALHLVMGIPIFAVIPIFTVGLVYKGIRDRNGLRTAYVAHLGTNLLLIGVVVAAILLLPPG